MMTEEERNSESEGKFTLCRLCCMIAPKDALNFSFEFLRL